MNQEKAIVVYFSHSGNTKRIAEEIVKQTSADIVELLPVHAYPTIYEECTTIAATEKTEAIRPPLATKIDNLQEYNTIYLGFPNWWSTAPMPIFTFLDQHDVANKTIKLFVTHGGGGISNCASDIKAYVSKEALIAEPLVISDGHIQNATSAIRKWI